MFNASDMRKLLVPIVTSALLVLPSAAEARVVELGGGASAVPASCPDNCQAVGQVTGYQAQTPVARQPFQVNRRGKIVAFTMQLGDPKPDQVDFFTKLFNGPPRARISILKPGTERGRNQLTGHSSIFDLTPYLGSSPTFVVSPPLTVKKGYTVALTVPTWAPAFSVNLASTEAWRSSRDPKRCDDVRQDAAQQTLRSQRTFGCLYRTARLLYTATFIPDPRKVKEPAREQTEDQQQQR